MFKRGQTIYAPKLFLDQLKMIKLREDIQSNVEAMNKLAKYAQLGQQVKLENRPEQRHIEKIRNMFEI